MLEIAVLLFVVPSQVDTCGSQTRPPLAIAATLLELVGGR